MGTVDQVLLPPFTPVATPGMRSRLNARPVLGDTERATYNLDPERREAAITNRTKAIMPVHLFGLAAEMEKINDIARAHRLPRPRVQANNGQPGSAGHHPAPNRRPRRGGGGRKWGDNRG